MVAFKDIADADRARLQVIVHRDVKRQLDHLAIDRRVSTSELVNEFLAGVLAGPGAAPGGRELAPST